MLNAKTALDKKTGSSLNPNLSSDADDYLTGYQNAGNIVHCSSVQSNGCHESGYTWLSCSYRTIRLVYELG